MSDFIGNLLQQPLLGVGLIAFLALLIGAGVKIGQELYWMGTIEFIKGWILTGLVSLVGVVGLSYLVAIYQTPASGRMAIVVGNTQNTPKAKLDGGIKTRLEKVMMQHAGGSVEDMADAISIVEADGDPYVINLDSSKLKRISGNETQAKIDIQKNIDAIDKQISSIKPKTSGVNYLEAILRASDELGTGDDYEEDDESNSSHRGSDSIIVIGSGLSDTGDLNFVGTNLLTDPSRQNDLIQKAANGHQKALDNIHVTFYGLGYTVAPQASLSTKQRDGVREIYTQLVDKLDGRATIETESLSGPAVDTPYTVNPTDTGCGNIELTFDDSKLKFNSDRASFVNDSNADVIADQIVGVYNQNKDKVKSIDVDGYIAHYQSSNPNLSLDRANAMKDLLIKRGIPDDKIKASGKGFGPYEYSNKESHDSTDRRNRMIKVTVQRDQKDCRE